MVQSNSSNFYTLIDLLVIGALDQILHLKVLTRVLPVVKPSRIAKVHVRLSVKCLKQKSRGLECKVGEAD